MNKVTLRIFSVFGKLITVFLDNRIIIAVIKTVISGISTEITSSPSFQEVKSFIKR